MRRFLFLLFACTLVQAGTLSGRLTTTTGDGVNEAIILILDETFLCPVDQAVTGSNGSYSATVDDGTYYVSYSGAGIISTHYGNDEVRNLATASRVTVSGNTQLDLTARLAGAISGTLRVDGVPTAGEEISLLDPYSLTDIVTTETGVDGRYVFQSVVPGCYLVGASYDPQEVTQNQPIVFLGDTFDPNASTRVVVSEAMESGNIDIAINTSQLATLSFSFITPPNTEASLSLAGNSAFPYGFSVGNSGFNGAYLPPGSYVSYISYVDSWLDQELSTITLTAGQNSALTANPQAGGTVSGTISYDIGLFGRTGYVQLINKDDGSQYYSETISLSSPSGSIDYAFTGVGAGQYTVRVNSINGTIGLPNFKRVYYPNADSLADAQTFSVSAGATTSGIDFQLTQGGAITGMVAGDNVFFSTSFITAINTANNEVYTGFNIPGLGYTVDGLPGGTYKVGINTGYGDDATLGGLLSLPFLFFCSNIGPSFYDNATSFDSAATVSVSEGGSVSGVDISPRSGGGFSVNIRGAGCDCNVQFGFVGAFQGETLRSLGIMSEGIAEVGGLPSGSYTLKLALPVYDETQDITDFESFTFSDLFTLFENYTYPSSVTINQGSFTNLDQWCINKNPGGGGSTGGNGGGGGNTTTEATLVYPWVSNREAQFESILIANNYGDESAQVTLTARRADGTSETVMRTIPGRGFLEEFASSLFPSLGSGAGYTVVLESTVSSVTGRWVTNNLTSVSGQSPSQGVAIRLDDNENQRRGTELVFGYLPVTNNFNSAPVITNVGDQATDVTLRFYNNAGMEVGTEVLQDLAPFLPFATSANTLVGGTEDVYMTASSNGAPITGVAFVFNNVGETAIGNASAISSDTVDTGSRELLYPWISNNADSFESIVVVNNYGNATANITLTGRRENGDTETVTAQIPPGGFLSELASSLFPVLGDGPGYAVALSADTSKIAGQWVTNNLRAASGGSPSQGVAVDTGQSDSVRSGESVMFGFLPLTNTFVSAPVIVNMGDNPTDIILTFYDENGTRVLEDTTTLQGLAPNTPFARVANDLVPEGTGDVYMVARSTDGTPISGVVFVFNADSEPAIGDVTAINFTP